MEHELLLNGAAAIPTAFTQLHLAYNSATLTATEDLVTVAVRRKYMAKFFALAGLRKVDDTPTAPYGWSARWDEIARVVTSDKSVIFYVEAGRGCRFATSRAERIRPLFDLIDARGIERQRVTSTIGKGYKL